MDGLYQKQRGVTLVELMVAITIGLMVMAGVVQLYATSSRTQKVQEGTSRLQENARFVFARLAKDISPAGFMGCADFNEENIANTLSDQSGAGQLYDFQTPLVGTNDDGLLGTDTLTVRFASISGRVPLVQASTQTAPLVVDDTHPNYALLEQYNIAVVSDCTRAAVFMITNDPSGSNGTIAHATGVTSPEGQSNSATDLQSSFGAAPGNYPPGGSEAFLYTGTVGAHTYAIGDSQSAAAVGGGAACTAATPEFCALFRDGQEIVQGVQDFQLELGWKTGALPSDGRARTISSFGDPGNLVSWADVDRVRVTLTLNSVEPVPTSQGVQLDQQTFSRTIMVRNQIR